MEITVDNIAELEIPADLESALLAKFEPKLGDFLTGKGHVVKAKADYDTAIKTAEDKGKKEAFKEETASVWNGADSVVGIALGVQKPNGMKTYDWFKQLETEGKFPLSAEALGKVKAAMKGESSETKNAVVEGLQKQIEDYQKAADTKATEAFAKTVKAAVNADLRNAPVKIDPDLKDEAAKTTAKNGAISDIKELFNTLYEGKEDSETGELYFVKKGTDKPLMNTAEQRPMTPTEIIRANHPMFLSPAGHEQKGTDTKKPSNPNGGFTSLAEIRQHAIKVKGFAAYSDEFNTFVKDEAKKANIKI